MRISKKQIEEFKQIYYQTFGETISDKKAYELALPLLHLFKVICRPLPGNHRCRACQPPEQGWDFDKRATSY
jgi:hypothetical protein